MNTTTPAHLMRESRQKSTTVGLGQLAVASAGGELVTYGLGSCIGLVLWSASKRIGALGHIVMPDSRGKPVDPKNPAKYADWAVLEMLKALRSRGVRKQELVAKLAGGARTLDTLSSDIGQQNTLSTLAVLKEQEIEVVARSVGGSVGRTIRFYPETGLVELRFVGGQRSTL
ncbi:MAG: chemotaxis protein CheD [Firmicutes bacterium]|mgnify:FL=1|jgi:chemotaxis protein CheD|nr:chemotaxis protein CheD [Bacillota bacterium]